MGKNKSKTWKHKWKKIKRNIKVNKKAYLWNLCIFILLLILISIFLLLYFRKLLTIEKNMFFWLFAATSQSMAALFAVVGMFAVFRYQDIQTRLRNLYDVLKEKFYLLEWEQFFGMTEARTWDDSIIVNRAEALLKEKKSDSSHRAWHNLEVDIIVIKSHERVRKNILKYTKTPMILILITFMLSIISLPFTECLSKNFWGVVILISLLVFITFSMLSIFRYFMMTISIR